MDRFLMFPIRYSWPILICILLLTVAATSQLNQLQIHISPQALTVDGDPAQEFYQQSVATFGADKITIVFLQDASLLVSDNLKAIKTVVEEINSLPFVSHTQSLFSVPNVTVTDEVVRAEPFLQRFPNNLEEKNLVLRSALKNPFVNRNLLSADGTAMAINVYMADSPRDLDFDRRASSAIELVLMPLQDRLDQVYQVGVPYVRSAIADQIQHDQHLIVISAMGVLLLSLLVTLRRGSAMFVPLVTASLSVVWTLGSMAILGIPINVMSASVPVLLIIIGSTEDVHLLSEYYKGIENRHSRLRAIRYMAKRMGLAIGLTFLTTFFGFLAIGANPVSLVRDFGLVAAMGLAFNFIITLLLLPVYLKYFGERHSINKVSWIRPLYRQFVTWLSRIILSYRPLILFALVGVVVGASYSALSLRVNNSILDYFDENSPIRQRAMEVHQKLSGLETFSIVLNGHIRGAFEQVMYLEEIQSIQRYLEEHPEFDYSVSIVDYLAVLNSAVNETGEPELPEEDEVVETLLLFAKHKDIKKYISADFSQASILVRHNISGSEDLAESLADLKHFIKTNTDKGLEIRITGQSILSNNASDYLAVGQIKSLSFMLLTIFIVVSLLFVNVKAGLIAVVSNLFPIVMLFGIMGYLGIPLDSGTSLVAAIALGVCVDHTMHFMVRYNQELRSRNNELDAIITTIQKEATPITAATIALAAGLGTLTLSSFEPVIYFGLLSALVILIAFIANFLITPILLSYIRLMSLWEVLSISLRRELLTKCALFRGMRPMQVRRIILLGGVYRYENGDTIMSQGQHGKELFILLGGSVTIKTKLVDGSVKVIQVTGVGEIFGLAALVCNRPRISTAVALQHATVLCLDWPRIERIARYYPRSAYSIFHNLSTILAERFAENTTVFTPGLYGGGVNDRGTHELPSEKLHARATELPS
ncbi:MAG: cyclic nucleotide-binding domain-containing protein [Gammaproteobacteria bacterium]|nr:MAG: cyclic nucleotide-binding domain-containing protein [Gammaproteobacteria bacterium]